MDSFGCISKGAGKWTHSNNTSGHHNAANSPAPPHVCCAASVGHGAKAVPHLSAWVSLWARDLQVLTLLLGLWLALVRIRLVSLHALLFLSAHLHPLLMFEPLRDPSYISGSW